ncbi:uncharacterized protein CPUR_07054 [Claviceps purpurea 20.1]|uniref:MUC1-Extracellular alpha-1,4-glucan glucosidase n=1 Tax=Claviceps purpurea (strain 20.1) TaxID=1111077 RepID=M1WAN4_CLAP2|nr:uncharacterized protein CPUR_07054 [Claviceps purpurea 20.1]
MAPPFFWVSAFLALNYGFAQANPDATEAAPVATMNIQPVKILTELPVSIRTHCPRPTKIVICHGKTLTVHRPGLFKTVVTLTYEEVKTRSRLNCGRRTAKTKTTPASSALANEETASSSGPITSDLTSSTESVFPGSFTTSPTTQSAPEISEPGSIPSDSEKGDRYTSASNSASSPPGKPFQGKFTSQPSPSSRINIDTAESQSSQTPFPSATTKTYGDYGDVPGASVSEASSSIVSLSDGSRTATSVEVRTKARSHFIESTDLAGSSQTPFPSATSKSYGGYSDVPGPSESEASTAVASLSDGSRTGSSVEVRTKARSDSIESIDLGRSSQTPFPYATTKTYGDYGDVPGASVSEASSSIVSLSDGSRIGSSVEVRTKAKSHFIESTDLAGSSQTPFPSATTKTYGDYGDVPGASVSESSTAVASLSDASRTGSSVEVRTKARSESIGSTDRARSSQASASEPSGSSPGQGSSSIDYVSSSPEAMITTRGVPQSSSTSTGGTGDVGSPVQPRPQTKVAPPSSFDQVVTEEPSSTSLTSISTGVQPSSSKGSFTQSNTATSSLQSDSVGPSSFDSSAIVQSSSASSLGVKSDGDLPSISKGAVLSTPSALERVKAGTSSSGANVSATSTLSTVQTEQARPSSSNNDDSTLSNIATSSSLAGKPFLSSSSGDVLTQLISASSSSYGPKSFDSSATVQPSSAISLSVQSDRAQPSSSKGAILSTPSALERVKAGTSSSGASVSATSSFSTLETEKATPSSSSNDDSTQSNFATSSSPTNKPLSSSFGDFSTQSNSATSSLQSENVGPSSFDSSAIVQPSSAISLTVQSDRDLTTSSKGAILSTPSALERVKAGTSSSGVSVSATSSFSTLQTEKATPSSSSNDGSTQSNFATSDLPTGNSFSSSFGDVLTQSNPVPSSLQSESVGPSSFDSSAIVRPSSAISLSVQSDRAQLSSSKSAILSTPSALERVKAGTSSSGANVSATSTLSTLQTEKATPSSSSNDDSTQSNFVTSSSLTDKPLSSSSADFLSQLTSASSSSYGPSSLDSSAMVQPSSARSLSVQSDRAQPSSSKGAVLSTPSALERAKAGTSSFRTSISATSSFSTLQTEKATPRSSTFVEQFWRFLDAVKLCSFKLAERKC